ncbi:MarR family transcriptional regulator [Massilia sp. IC2-476]|uniref:MarR family winged helix-turn-helix transcriptional regulator n=1 Tax=Massilia sp. IC2-476 TaxID=2887199 RepID=UPI001D12090E|nr:MarR family transcriptional regulator [Massilia sp. IC2-476]
MFEAIHEIMHLFRAQQYRSLRATEHELSHMENRALGYIARHPGATQRDLAERSGRDKAQVTRLVQGLREKGLVEVRADELDRRSTRLHLTPAGAVVYAEVRRHGEQLAAQALAGLDGTERAQLEALLGRVEERLRAQGALTRVNSEG